MCDHSDIHIFIKHSRDQKPITENRNRWSQFEWRTVRGTTPTSEAFIFYSETSDQKHRMSMNIMHTWCDFIDVLISFIWHIDQIYKNATNSMARPKYSQWQMTTVVYCESTAAGMVMVWINNPFHPVEMVDSWSSSASYTFARILMMVSFRIGFINLWKCASDRIGCEVWASAIEFYCIKMLWMIYFRLHLIASIRVAGNAHGSREQIKLSLSSMYRRRQFIIITTKWPNVLVHWIWEQIVWHWFPTH